MGKDTARLLKLSDSTLTLERPDEDLRGKAIFDADGQQIGKVDDLFVDGQERKARFLLIHSGGFLGMGSERSLIPIDAIEKVDATGVHLSHVAEHIAGAPKYDPEIVDDQYYTNVYGYYGYGPYWGPGYMYPAYPFVP